MANFIASYDLESSSPDPHSTFLEEAEKVGWQPWIKGSDDRWHRLPNTTLIGVFPDLDKAVSALRKAKSETSAILGTAVNMEKWIVTQRNAAKFVSDDVHPVD